MDDIWFFLGLLAIIALVGAAGFTKRANKFAGMGDITNKTLEEIIAVVGKPTAMSAQSDGATLYQWMETGTFGGYHYCILFKDDKCLGYTHQFVTQ